MKIAVVGASGAVGREMLVELLGNGFNPNNILPFATARSAGSIIEVFGHAFKIEEYNLTKARSCKYALLSAGSTFSREEGVKLAAAGTTIIDNSSAFRSEDDIPLVVPEVNPHTLKNIGPRRIIANPNCSTIQLVQTLKPLDQAFGISLVFVSTMQSVSGTGYKGIEELAQQIRDQQQNLPLTCRVYAKPIVSNVLPAIGNISSNGYCEEETKIVNETRKIMEKPDLAIFPHTARVPVFYCHSETVTVKLLRHATLKEITAALCNQPALDMLDTADQGAFATPVEWARKTATAVFRLRLAFDAKESSDMLSYWNLADNLKVGAATNAVKILKMCLS